MEISSRDVDGVLIIDLCGPLPQADDDRTTTDNAFRDVLSGRTTDFIITLREIEFLSSADVGIFISLLLRAEVVNVFGSGPFVRIVSDNDRVRRVFTAAPTPFRTFATEEEALASLNEGVRLAGGVPVQKEPVSWHLRIWLFLKAVIVLCWIAIFVVVETNLVRQGAWFMSVVTLIVLVLSVIAVRRWFGLAFSPAGHHDSAPTEGQDKSRQPSVDRLEVQRKEMRQKANDESRVASIQHPETRVIDRLFVVVVVLGLLTLGVLLVVQVI